MVTLEIFLPPNKQLRFTVLQHLNHSCFAKSRTPYYFCP